jgi:hypothetical protein
MGERRGINRTLVGKPDGRRPLGRPKHRLKYNIKIDPRKLIWGRGLDISGSGQGQMAGFCEWRNKQSVSNHYTP